MNDPMADLRELLRIYGQILSAVNGLGTYLNRAADAVEHQLRDYEAVLDHRTADPDDNRVVF